MPVSASTAPPGYRGRVLRTLATGKWVALTLGGLLVIVAFGALSFWQWQRAQRDQVPPEPVPAASVLSDGVPLAAGSYGTRVSMTGAYDAEHQVLVAHAKGYWVVTPLRGADGLVVPVARADVSSPDDPATAVTPGTVSVIGWAQPYEGDPGGARPDLPAGTTDRMTLAGLDLPYSVAGGWIALQTQDPAAAASVVRPVVGGEYGGPLRLQNVSYALQWAVFAGFIVFFWVRMLRDDLRAVQEAPPVPTEPVREVY